MKELIRKAATQFCALLCVVSLHACNNEVSMSNNEQKLSLPIAINCAEVAVPDSSNLPVLQTLNQVAALERAREYLAYTSCQKQFPEGFLMSPYFFAPEDLGTTFTAVEFSEGFNKQPSSLKVETDTGMALLFCFNKMVINCNVSAQCECPYDFNSEPKVSGG
ncbi:hypothetical protein [Hahella sp. HN01]|uniref:hypothetical protein n=1 Tax=Hahella sp. HN01 TaxID=2847262 RepID=UPI001C1EE106|nr:hypothetical protein [Hahella sp. HN01]MBU6952588.1 hypothetical protein [Hahella sp. HN01]